MVAVPHVICGKAFASMSIRPPLRSPGACAHTAPLAWACSPHVGLHWTRPRPLPLAEARRGRSFPWAALLKRFKIL